MAEGKAGAEKTFFCNLPLWQSNQAVGYVFRVSLYQHRAANFPTVGFRLLVKSVP